MVAEYQLVLDFFVEHKLLNNAEKRQKEFKDYVYGDSGILSLIDDAKNFSRCNRTVK